MNNKIYKCSAWLVFLAISVWSIGMGSNQINLKAQAQEAEQPLFVTNEPVPPPPPPPVVHGEWCSALYGAFSSTIHRNNEVINMDGLGGIDISDTATFVSWYAAGDNAACRARFEPTTGNFNFNQSNYLNIDWCQGIMQGIRDTLGSHRGDPNYSEIFDLNHDGAMDLTDTVMAVQYGDDQAACYLHYVPPMPSWPAELFCGDGIVNGNEQCDGGEPVSCTTDAGYAGTKSCNMPPQPSKDVFAPQGVEEPLYCVFNPCVTQELCGDSIVNGNEQCDAGPDGSDVCTPNCAAIIPPNPQPGPSGGGGGGGYIPINIFNVQVTPGIDKATITWQTSKSSITWMFYGLDIALETENKDSIYKSTHTIDLSNLKPGTTYHYQLRAQDSGGNTAYDIERTFTTLSASGGIVPQVLGTKEVACVPKIDKDIKNIMQFANGKLIRSCGPEVYLLVQGKKYHIPSWQILHDNFFAKRIYNVSEEILALYPDFVGTVSGIKIK